MTRVHVYGASGYAAVETIAFLLNHPQVELGALESVSHADAPVGLHFPRLRKFERSFDGPGAVLEQALPGDAAILAGGHGAAKAIVPQLLERGVRAIDLSGDFRLDPTPAVYGFSERYRARIRDARLIANPGCYPTATLLATLPLAPFNPTHIIVDAKSGITGAGRTPSVTSLFGEVDGEIRAYGLTGHRHEPEIVQEWRAAGISADLVFTPQVVPISRGMLVTAYATVPVKPDADAIQAAFACAYADNPFVRVLENATPSLASVVGTNDAELHVSLVGSTARIICAIDNLGRGAAAQAVVNFNIMHGYPEELGLHARQLAC